MLSPSAGVFKNNVCMSTIGGTCIKTSLERSATVIFALDELPYKFFGKSRCIVASLEETLFWELALPPILLRLIPEEDPNFSSLFVLLLLGALYSLDEHLNMPVGL